ncbi:type IX secretion system outer membrane channel protein PorV [Adhaeribacter rhizoryzae]|uniref:Type IX secretion system outer membrane channel protein PorV n=1 Tax=Adhaeribacter rhizoryzae TaxID=2607907 RepID=A0A5M6DPN0_9BACT|nr:type IX secretion system outer membrane channel protein PorV [Adhaeribacter rhizoryzae]KAA5547425.1 type IX secretion system outer membrane channel protein PorV [Adhaeribacter rhizoryzae]
MKYNSGIKKSLPFLVFLSLIFTGAVAQNQSATGSDVTTITTAVPILTVSPDARSAGMGDAGVAISPDANTAHWNPAKLGFVTNDMSVGLSYSPWLRNIINDMSLTYLSGYKRVSQRGAFSASMLYFDLGDIQFTDDLGNPLNIHNPKEYTFDLAYGQQLSNNLSVGVGARFIHSNLSAGISDSRPGNSAAVDIGVYYTNDLTIGARDYNLSFGGNISNIGAKIAYTNADQKDFLPTNLRLGTAFTMNLDPYNKITLAIDGNKLLVPSPDSTNTGNISVPRAIFSSFGDARNGFSEEMQEISLSTGLEYWYNDVFAARAGYFYESPNKGDRHYLSMGLGMRYQKFGIDVAYLVPNSRNNPLANTLRFTLVLNIDKEEE